MFNETLYFHLKKISQDELEQTVIKLSLYDHNSLSFDSFLGCFTIDAAYIYQMNSDHELYRRWVALSDTTDKTEGVKGYLKVTVNVLGPDDKPPVHNEQKDKQDNVEDEDESIFSPGRIEKQGMLVKFNWYVAEDLPQLDRIYAKCDSYIKVTFAGVTNQTNVVNNRDHPKFDTQLQMPVMLPWMNRKIVCEVWDENIGYDERVATFTIPFPQKEEDMVKTSARWANLYGPLPHTSGEKAEYMTRFPDSGKYQILMVYIATYYRGRVLYSLDYERQDEPKNKRVRIKYEDEENPRPYPDSWNYILRVDLYDGFDLPEESTLDKTARVFITIGPERIRSEKAPVINNTCIWNQSYPDLVFRSPYDVDQMPDIIVYLSESIEIGESVSFVRIPVRDVLYRDDDEETTKVKQYTLIEDLSRNKLHDEEFPGILNMRITIYEDDPPPRELDQMPSFEDLQNLYQEYVLRVYLFMGRDLPAADENGLSDPFIIVKWAGESRESKVKNQTLNPGWFQTLEMTVKIPQIGTEEMPKPSVSLLWYDRDSFGRKDLLGRTIMTIDGSNASFRQNGDDYHYVSYKYADWYKLHFDALNEDKGYILAGYGLMTVEDARRCPPISIIPQTLPCNLNIVWIGWRDIIDSMSFVPIKRLSWTFDISGDSKEPIETNKHLVSFNSWNLSEIISVPVDIPIDPLFSPVLSVYIYDHALGLIGTRLIGMCHIPLNRYVKIALKQMLEYKREGRIAKFFHVDWKPGNQNNAIIFDIEEQKDKNDRRNLGKQKAKIK